MSKRGSKKAYLHLHRALSYLKEMRDWAAKDKVDAWIIRQALITVLEYDNQAAKAKGVTEDQLEAFDKAVVDELRKET